MKNLKNTYSELPKEFHRSINPTPVSKPEFLCLNRELANELFIDTADENKLLQYFSGNEVPGDSSTIAMAYAGHQFGNFVPQLGDGRAILLGELYDKEKKLNDIQLKGSGVTAFSRQGDGRSAIGPVIREFILSEAMHAMNIPTTRALAAVYTGENVSREAPVKGGILTRVSNSLIRVGTFEFFRARQDLENLKVLADFTINRLYPKISDEENKYLLLFEAISEKQSTLVSKWMSIGFIHGVMNTDNFTISGETIDYGPCAFLDEYHPGKVFSSIDQSGRYAFGNQPSIASWNLASLAGCLIAFIDKDSDKANKLATEVLENFSIETNQRILDLMCQKIGLAGNNQKNQSLLKRLLKIMMDNQSDYTITFRGISEVLRDNLDEFYGQFNDREEIDVWLIDWQNQLKEEHKDIASLAEQLDSINPAFIPRNHILQEVIEGAYENDFTKFYEMIEIIKNPFVANKETSSYMTAPLEEQKISKTFCGT